jgi:sortase A
MATRIERFLFGLGFSILGWCAVTVAESRLYQAFHRNDFEKTGTRSTLVPTPASLARRRLPEGTAVGRIEIPRIGISSIVAEGETDATLRLAVGHIPGTAFPGENGNAGLAGHRDTFFRPLARIRLHDEIRLTTKGGADSRYRVDSISIVDPGDVGVLESGPLSSVTLVTCYPFHFVGAAPKRFVVRAGRVPS